MAQPTETYREIQKCLIMLEVLSLPILVMMVSIAGGSPVGIVQLCSQNVLLTTIVILILAVSILGKRKEDKE